MAKKSAFSQTSERKKYIKTDRKTDKNLIKVYSYKKQMHSDMKQG